MYNYYLCTKYIIVENQVSLIKLKNLQYIKHLQWGHSLSFDEIIEGLTKKDTLDELKEFFLPISKTKHYSLNTPMNESPVFSCLKAKNNVADLNKAREILGKSLYSSESLAAEKDKS